MYQIYIDIEMCRMASSCWQQDTWVMRRSVSNTDGDVLWGKARSIWSKLMGNTWIRLIIICVSDIIWFVAY